MNLIFQWHFTKKNVYRGIICTIPTPDPFIHARRNVRDKMHCLQDKGNQQRKKGKKQAYNLSQDNKQNTQNKIEDNSNNYINRKTSNYDVMKVSYKFETR